MIQKVIAGLRRHWLRLLVGGIAMWLVANGFWILMFVYLESQHVRYSDYDLALVIYATLLLSWPLGVMWAWMRR